MPTLCTVISRDLRWPGKLHGSYIQRGQVTNTKKPDQMDQTQEGIDDNNDDKDRSDDTIPESTTKK